MLHTSYDFKLTPLLIPHATSTDDDYNGYFIPKNTSVMGNIWYVTFNVYFPFVDRSSELVDPKEFRPERFLKDAALSKDVCDPRNAFFWIWQKVRASARLHDHNITREQKCAPGRHPAEQALSIMVSSVLSMLSSSVRSTGGAT